MIGLEFNFDHAKSMSLRNGLFLKCFNTSVSNILVAIFVIHAAHIF